MFKYIITFSLISLKRILRSFILLNYKPYCHPRMKQILAFINQRWNINWYFPWHLASVILDSYTLTKWCVLDNCLSHMSHHIQTFLNLSLLISQRCSFLHNFPIFLVVYISFYFLTFSLQSRYCLWLKKHVTTGNSCS